MIADTLGNTIADWFLFAMLVLLVLAAFLRVHEAVGRLRSRWGGGTFPSGWRREAQGYRETRKMERHMGRRHGL